MMVAVGFSPRNEANRLLRVAERRPIAPLPVSRKDNRNQITHSTWQRLLAASRRVWSRREGAIRRALPALALPPISGQSLGMVSRLEGSAERVSG